MVRILFFSFIILASSASLWQQHVPASTRAKAPATLDNALVTIDTAVTAGAVMVANYVMPKTETQLDVGPTADNPLSFGGDGDIVTVYEAVSEDHLSDGAFDNTIFLGAELAQAQFVRAKMNGVLFDGAKIKHGLFSDVYMRGASARVANFSDTVFFRSDLSTATLDGSDFTNTVFTGSRLVGAAFASGTLDGAIVRDSEAAGATFIGATLTDARFERTNLRRSSFESASLNGAQFTETPLHGASFEKADLSGADFSSALGLTQALLSGACGNSETKLPRGLTLTPCEGLEGLPTEPNELAIEEDASPQRLAQR